MAKFQINASQVWLRSRNQGLAIVPALAPLPGPVTPERGENVGPGSDSASAVYLPAHEPQHDEHNQDDAEDAAEPGAPVSAVSIISPASAEEEDQDYDKENCTHISALGR
jgi:hypothetical protein